VGHLEEIGAVKILVIGHTGFIGQELVERLLQAGHDVRGMDVRPSESRDLPSYTGDVRNKAEVLRAARDVDLIVSLAAEHRDFGITTESYFAVNDVGTLNVVEAAADLGISRLLFFSSVAVYGPGTSLSEDAPLAPNVPYGASKVAGEGRVVAWASADSRRQAVILRPTVVFGPRNFGNMYNLIRTIAARRFVMVGDGSSTKSVAYVANVADATLYLIDRMAPGLAVYNYCDYPQMTSRELVALISTVLGRRPPRLRLPLGPVLSAARVVDLAGRLTGYDFPITANRIRKLNTSTAIVSDKIRAEGFQQKTSIEEGLRVTASWYRSFQKPSA
jgi:nucleoside-diphosphate-sugar epimerase